MASINYRIKGKANPGTIRIRFKQGADFDFEISTGLKVNLEHWSSAKQRVKNSLAANYAIDVNEKLGDLTPFVEQAYFKEVAKGNPITTNWLKDQLNIFFDRKPKLAKKTENYLTDFIDEFIKISTGRINRKTGKTISNKTIGWYRVTKGKIEDFEDYTGKKILTNEIDLNFHQSFCDFLSTQQNLNPNTIGGHIRRIRLFAGQLERKGVKVSPDYKSKDFFLPFNKTLDTYLTKEEIQAVYECDYSNHDKLDNARDWFVIGLWTGLRVSDFLSLTKDNIDDGLLYVLIKKTEQYVFIPIHPNVAAILKKRNGEFPRKISDVKFNEYIKEIAKDAGLTEKIQGAKMVTQEDENGNKTTRKQSGLFHKYELVSSHICRRSFATNHYGEIDTLTIMKITGHSTEKQFLDYIKVTPKEYAEKLRNYWKLKQK